MFIVECKPDVILVISLASTSRRRVEHAGNKSRVLRKLMRNYQNSTGVIDEDPGSIQPPDLQKFRVVESLERDGLKILQHTRRNNRLIVLCPRLEEWVIAASREANIDLANYSLPNDPDHLGEIINVRPERFERLAEGLMNSSSERVRTLRTRLRE